MPSFKYVIEEYKKGVNSLMTPFMNNATQRIKLIMDNYDFVFSYHRGHKIETHLIKDDTCSCRFCGKSFPDVKFTKKAHAVSELIGNKELVLKNECDSCNKRIGELFEDQFAKYVGIGRTLSQISGKNGVPSVKSKDSSWRIDFTNKGLVIQMKSSNEDLKLPFPKNQSIETMNNNIVFHGIRDSYIPLSVYKSLVVMALSIMPTQYLREFDETFAWIIQDIDPNREKLFDFSGYANMLFRFIPGMYPLGYGVYLLIRKNESDEYPFCVFYLEIANFSFQIAVPCIKKDFKLVENNNITLVPILGKDENAAIYSGNFAYNSILPNLIDLKNPEIVKDDPFDICLHFDYMESYSAGELSFEELIKREGIELKKRL